MNSALLESNAIQGTILNFQIIIIKKEICKKKLIKLKCKWKNKENKNGKYSNKRIYNNMTINKKEIILNGL